MGNGFANKPSCTVGDVGNSRRHYKMQAYVWLYSKDAVNGVDRCFYDNINHFSTE